MSDTLRKHYMRTIINSAVGVIFACLLLGMALAQGLGLGEPLPTPDFWAPTGFIAVMTIVTMWVLRTRSPALVDGGRGMLVALVVGVIWGVVSFVSPQFRQVETLIDSVVYGLVSAIMAVGLYDGILKPATAAISRAATPKVTVLTQQVRDPATGELKDLLTTSEEVPVPKDHMNEEGDIGHEERAAFAAQAARQRP